MRKALMFAALILTTLGSLAIAQEKPSVGLTAGYPASIGILWRASDKVAIRPEVAFTGQWSDSKASPGTSAVSSSGTSITVGVSLLFYFAEREGLRPYFSPRFSYARSSSDVDATSLSGGGSHTTGNTYSVIGSIGAEYGLGRRFGIFGELGLGYGRQSSSLNSYSGSGSNGVTSGTSNSFGTRTAVGVIVWF